ncbi:MAG: homoserine kinase [Acidobacteriota bacterium]|nr:homoserine kinase [Acidobacteriota bacterium]
MKVRAPATAANLGPGFDIAGVAFDLWNEVEIGEGNGHVDEENLVVRAFATFASPEGRSFTFVERIPRERGLGSSASAVALGLVAGAIVAGVERSADELLERGLDLEGHPDNLAAALAGGVCLTWEGRIARIADDLPAGVVAVIPETRVLTANARGLLPQAVPHEDAAFSAGRAALLGAALAAGSPSLLAASAADRLHEPYRAEDAPHLGEIRRDLPGGAIGAALSGSGPTVLVWAERGREGDVERELARRFPDCDVRRLSVTSTGAGPA